MADSCVLVHLPLLSLPLDPNGLGCTVWLLSWLLLRRLLLEPFLNDSQHLRRFQGFVRLSEQ